MSVLNNLCKRVILETTVRQLVLENDGELIHHSRQQLKIQTARSVLQHRFFC